MKNKHHSGNQKDLSYRSTSFNGDTLVFNTNEGINDLTGSLQATVHFAQSQIIPAAPRPNDPQPTLVANRRTLLMVKPAIIVDDLNVTVKDSSGGTLGSLALDSPEDLPNATPKDISFTQPAGSHYIIDSRDEIEKLNDPKASFLNGLLQKYELIQIRLADGRWTSNIYLPHEVDSGKVVTIKSNAGYISNVHYSNATVYIRAGNEENFEFMGSQWIRESALYNKDILYAQNTWSVTLPQQWIKPGISMSFTSGELTGELNNIAVGAPTQLLLNTIDIGMLTPPRNKFTFTESPKFHREYFQTVPVSRMIVSAYQAVHLTEVMLPNGKFYTDHAPGLGDWHNGVLREDIGKVLICQGINYANYGMNSSAGSGYKIAIPAAQFTVTNSVGKYENGVQIHGGSGGAAMVTLDQSIGNEFSHEVGHAYNLPHYPNGFDGSVHRPANKINSTWGWDADYDIFLPNFKVKIDNQPSCIYGTCQPPFYGHSFGFDPMAGGSPMSPFNSFTMHTPYTANLVQEFLESKMTFSSDSPTKFLKWNKTTKTMESYTHRVDIESAVVIPNSDLSESAIAEYLVQNNILKIVMYDGNWTRDIHVPVANMNNAGRIISIDDNAGYVGYLYINQAAPIAIPRGFHASYKSDGTYWNEIILLDNSESRVSAHISNGDPLNLQEYINNDAVISVDLWDGHWVPTINIPPASADNRKKVVIISHSATFSTELLFNGLQRLLNSGDTVYYISDGNSWVERTELVDLSIERAPYAFGVPVTTLIGYYDPQGILQPYIYPAFHGAYGFLYNDDQEMSSSTDWQLWVESENETLRFRLLSSRVVSDIMNKFHVNIPETKTPRTVSLVRDGVKILTRDIEPVRSSLEYTVNGV